MSYFHLNLFFMVLKEADNYALNPTFLNKTLKIGAVYPIFGTIIFRSLSFTLPFPQNFILSTQIIATSRLRSFNFFFFCLHNRTLKQSLVFKPI